jgi:hypothetical protein
MVWKFFGYFLQLMNRRLNIQLKNILSVWHPKDFVEVQNEAKQMVNKQVPGEDLFLEF